MRTKSVMIIDDDKDARNTFALILGLEGYQVLEAENGKKALEVLKKLPEGQLPGCLLLDMMMPVMDGKTLLGILGEKENSRLKKIPVVLTSCNSYLLNSINSDMAISTISKPVDLGHLCQTINRSYSQS